MAASTYLDQVQQLYIAYFGRPADPTGQAYWAGVIDAANGSIAAVLAGFSASSESQALFGNKTTIDKVTAIYQNVFGRSPEPAGLAYWVAQIDSGKVSQAQASWTIQQSAGAGDAATVQNKLTAAKAFTAQIDTTAEITGYQGTAAADSARSFLKTVTSDNATATAAVAGAATALAAAVSVGGIVGSTLSLTTGVDTITGTANNDTIVGVYNDTAALQTLSAGDTINGGAGVDTLKVVVANAGAATTPLVGVTVTNVEKLSFQNVSGQGTSVNVAAIAGVTSVASVNSTSAVSYTGLAAATEILVSGSGNTAQLNFAYNTATDAVKVTVDGGVNNTTVSASAGSATTASVNSTGGANGATAANTLKLTNGASSLTTLNVNADTSLRATLTANDFAAAGAALTVTGSAAVNLGTAGVFKTIDASANAGGLTVGLSSVTTSFKGGAGNDLITGTTPVAATATIDGGAGVDTVAATLITSANAAVFKNFEQIELGGAAAGTLDAALLTGSTISGVTINSALGGSYNFTNLVETTAGFNVAVNASAGAGNNTTLGFTTASVAGTADVLNLNFNASPAAATTIAANTITAQGIETVNISSKGSTNVNGNSVTLTDNALKSVVITGDKLLTLSVTGATAASALTSIDASAATGGVVITTAAPGSGALPALTIKGSSGSDTITVVTSATAASVGATITTGAGNDKVDVTGAAYTASNSVTTITDFAKGDSLQFAAAVGTNFTQTKVDVSTKTSLADALTAAVTATNTASWFTYGGDTYVVANGTGTAFDATDVVVKLSGIQDLSSSSAAAGLLTYA